MMKSSNFRSNNCDFTAENFLVFTVMHNSSKVAILRQEVVNRSLKS